jgi:hypothetical protein
MLTRYQMNANCRTGTFMTFQRTVVSSVYTAPELSTEIRVGGRTLPAQMVCIAIDAWLWLEALNGRYAKPQWRDEYS